jgi:large subunit ribosomal protein L3
MAGHLGNVKRTVQLLEVARVDAERSIIMIKGSVPGSKNGSVILLPSVKTRVSKAPKAAAKGAK